MIESNKIMKGLIEEFPNNLTEAIEIAKNSAFRLPQNEILNIVICGMGGSGIGGKIVAQWLVDDLKVPVNFCQGYDLPNYVNKNTLVIASSYSGNTEETIISLEKAIATGAHIVAITSGGKLAEICRTNQYDHVIVPGGNPPRTALAYSLVQLVNIFVQLNMCPAIRLEEIAKGHDLIVADKENIQQEAKRIAEKLKDKIPVLYSSDAYEALAIRVRQQFNENAKRLSWAGAIPEMNHNELVGWGGGDNRFGVVFFDTKDLNAKNEQRLSISVERVKSKTDTVIVLEAKGMSKIEKTLYLNNVMDWVTFYHADLNGTDSIEIEIIDYLKDSLAKS